MATKVQAKAAIDAAVVQAKAEIDNALPVGVNILDGSINFGPVKLSLLLDAGSSLATANATLSSIKTYLDSVARTYIVTGNQGRRGPDPKISSSKSIVITSDLTTYNILNIG